MASENFAGRYYLIWERVCRTCDGTGYGTDPFWRDFYAYAKENPGADPDEYAREHAGLYKAPPEEVPCPECDGAGTVRIEVDLRRALDSLGVIHYGWPIPGQEEEEQP